MTVNKGTNKQIMIYLYNGMLPPNKKKWTINTHNNMDESQNNYAVWEKPDRKSIYYIIPFI